MKIINSNLDLVKNKFDSIKNLLKFLNKKKEILL